MLMALAGHLTVSADVTRQDDGPRRPPVTECGLPATEEPSFTNEIVVGSPWSANWFATVSGGASVFVGSPIGCGDMFDRMMPALQVSLGKWFTPAIGVRAGFQGLRLKDHSLESRDYQLVHADLLWNVIGADSKNELGLSRWTVAPYLGGGIVHNGDNGHKPFALTYGVMAQYRLARRLSVNMELSGMSTFRDFDGKGAADKLGDSMFSLTAGLAINIGKVGWRRPVDATSYLRQNELLIDYISSLQRDEAGGGGHDGRDGDRMSRTRGDYSGLASLRARIAAREKDGDGGMPSFADSLSERMNDGRRLIGVPFYFFFRIGTAELTDMSQLQNLENLARVARAYHLNVYVDGAADSATGTDSINSSLSEARAAYIAQILRQQGVDADAVRTKAEGGIDKFSPKERNRHTRVMIKSD